MCLRQKCGSFKKIQEERNMKKIAAFAVALIMAAANLTACSKDNKDGSSSGGSSSTTDNSSSQAAEDQKIDVDDLVIPEKELVIDGEEVDTDELVMMTINDKYQVSFDEFRYFYFLVIRNTQMDFENIDEEFRKEAFKDLLSTVELQIKNFYSYMTLADELGIEFTADDENEVKVKQQENASMFDSAEDCETYYQSLYATTEVVNNTFKQEIIYNKITDKLFGEGGTYYVSQDDFLKFAKTDDYAQVKHILISYASQAELSDSDKEGFDDLSLSEKVQLKDAAYAALSDEDKKAVNEKAKSEAEKVLAEVESGKDFDELVKTYGWDPGMEQTPEGYFVTERTSFVPEFLDAAFKLKPGENSKLVESSYGYHIIKREPVDETYLNDNVETLYNDYFNEIMNTEGSALLNETVENMKVENNEILDKLSYDSIS